MVVKIIVLKGGKLVDSYGNATREPWNIDIHGTNKSLTGQNKKKKKKKEYECSWQIPW